MSKQSGSFRRTKQGVYVCLDCGQRWDTTPTRRGTAACSIEHKGDGV